MKDKKTLVLLVILSIIAIETTYLAVKSTRHIFTKGQSKGSFDTYKNLSEEYLNSGLYEKAVESYEKYLRNPHLDEQKKSNISYIIGNIYMENLTDYENAMASFIRAKVFSPSGPNISGINKKIIACLERLGRSVDSEREMAKLTNIGEEPLPQIPASKEQEIIVAKLGEKNITMAELNSEIAKLPEYMKENYKEASQRLEFLKQYVAGELLYDSAKRSGFDNDKDVIATLHNVKKQLMVEKLLKEEIALKLTEPTEVDLKLYYEAHKNKYVEEDKDEEGNVTKTREKSFEEVKPQVNQEYIIDKQQEKLQNLVDELTKAEDVKIYDGLFK